MSRQGELQLFRRNPLRGEGLNNLEAPRSSLSPLLVVEQQLALRFVFQNEEHVAGHLLVDEAEHVVGAVKCLERHQEEDDFVYLYAIGRIERGGGQLVEPVDAGYIIYKMLLDAGVHIEVFVEGVLRHGFANQGCGREMQVDHRRYRMIKKVMSSKSSSPLTLP